MDAFLSSLNISPGGMPKLPVHSARLTLDGLDGDYQLNRKYHGGPNRALCLYSVELYSWLGEQDIPLLPGSLGENITTQNLDLAQLAIGSQLRVGSCLIEITNVRTPCKSLSQWHPRLMKIIQGRSGWVAKVLKEGLLYAGDLIVVSNIYTQK